MRSSTRSIPCCLVQLPEEFALVLGSADELAVGGLVGFDVDGEARILVRLEEGFFALDGLCTHEEADLADAEIEGTTLWCPLHSAGFDVRTGSVVSPPAECPLRAYDVRVTDGGISVARRPRRSAQ